MRDDNDAFPGPRVEVRLTSPAEDLLRSIDPWPKPSAMPLILDTDIGGEPDDALTLTVAANLPNLALVTTSDERDGERARLARHLLDLLGRQDVPVISGTDLGNRSAWAADGLVPSYIPAQPTNIGAAVLHVLDRHHGQVGWVGLGPMSNLAELLTSNPNVGSRLVVTQQEAAFRIIPDYGGQNIAMDPTSAQAVLDANLTPWIVPTETTFQPFTEITEQSAEYKISFGSNDPAHVLLRKHIEEWFDYVNPSIGLHGPMTLSLAVGMPFLTAISAKISVDNSGRIQPGTSPCIYGYERRLCQLSQVVHESTGRD